MYGFLLNPISSKTSISWTWLMVSNAFFRSTNIYYIVDKPPASILLLMSFVSDTNGTSCGHILLYYFILIIWKFFLPDWSPKLLSASLTTVFFIPIYCWMFFVIFETFEGILIPDPFTFINILTFYLPAELLNTNLSCKPIILSIIAKIHNDLM